MGYIRCRIDVLLIDKGYKERRKIRQKELAEYLGLSNSAISAMLTRHNHVPHGKHLAKLCDYFDCTVGDILEYIPDSD